MIKSLDNLRQQVYMANMDLPKVGLVKLTWGNVSIIDREQKVVIIKPSGLPYERMTEGDMVITDLQGNVVDGTLRPSSDLTTHLTLYKSFPDIGAVVHTHSKWAVKWAQSGRDIPAYGTTHADTFYGDIPCTRPLKSEEINGNYEVETGNVIVETFNERQIDPLAIPGVLVNGHGPFTWGKTASEAVNNSIILDEVAEMAIHTELLYNNYDSVQARISQELLDKHYFRKHGPNAYYGQRSSS
ncbi:L-ribulose-5-phosphate 4-epimerase [Bacillus sp. Marseille-P3661]|uniref:L-ribulose-5-phosphate 4-epimerase n=1 Tax=Bacillus sp. Marseille-P3661 TaxID=1936234 RepID=UPI000C81ECF6|nr:L-ribulose-5-phosphate 4-epimerase [Bacillus sp. Marseille-P3661]